MSSARADPSADIQVVSIAPDGSHGPSVGRLLAHRPPGILHLAVSVALVDPDGRWLLQRRAVTKAAFPGQWANSCCTHPEPGEEPASAAIRRVREELGLEVSGLTPAGTFTYRAPDPASGLVEYELDHVFVALTDTSSAVPDPGEVGALARLPIDEALELVSSDDGAPWAAQVLERASRRRPG
ncbi:MAG: isopentenyl-diphosphate Delta-isomerase [Solirubrobacteraceae bacterium]|jgi:isopentenyl-diphosphate delta-isomerase|nr:isopentenyl-diphosphate Delta-isomerase [Solirubrobacteraceae bacterium]